jgi:hypothetical protein
MNTVSQIDSIIAKLYAGEVADARRTFDQYLSGEGKQEFILAVAAYIEAFVKYRHALKDYFGGRGEDPGSWESSKQRRSMFQNPCAQRVAEVMMLVPHSLLWDTYFYRRPVQDYRLAKRSLAGSKTLMNMMDGLEIDESRLEAKKAAAGLSRKWYQLLTGVEYQEPKNREARRKVWATVQDPQIKEPKKAAKKVRYQLP